MKGIIGLLLMEISEAKAAKFTHLWLLFIEESKIFGPIGKFTVRKNRLVEIMKFIYKFASLQNASVTVHNC